MKWNKNFPWTQAMLYYFICFSPVIFIILQWSQCHCCKALICYLQLILGRIKNMISLWPADGAQDTSFRFHQSPSIHRSCRFNFGLKVEINWGIFLPGESSSKISLRSNPSHRVSPHPHLNVFCKARELVHTWHQPVRTHPHAHRLRFLNIYIWKKKKILLYHHYYMILSNRFILFTVQSKSNSSK